MGKGDKKSKKGKIFKGSYGVTRKKNSIKAKKTASKKATGTTTTDVAAKPKRAAKKKAEA